MSPAPLDLVDLLFYLKRFEVIEFGLMGLEFGMEFVFAGFFLVSSVLASFLEHIRNIELRKYINIPFRSSRIIQHALPCLRLPDSFLYDQIQLWRLCRLQTQRVSYCSSNR